MLSNKTVLTGVKPTGSVHLGNLVGAIKPIIDMSKQAKEAYVFIADLHALNAVKDPKEIQRCTYEIAATYLALGLDPERAILWRQSDIAEVYQLTVLLTNVTPKGLMNRSHAYKASVDKNVENGQDADIGVNMGLYNYPILMAADILLYDTDVVPVGRDQRQHIEFTRDIATSFNTLYGKDMMRLPEGHIQEETMEIPGLDGRKMSKSYDNTIPIFEDSKKLRKLIMKIVTDSALPEDKKDPDSSTIYNLYKIIAPAEKTQAFKKRFEEGGLGYGDAKQTLYEELDAFLAKPREKYNALMQDTDKLDQILAAGAERARKKAEEVYARASKGMLGRITG